MYTAQVVPSSGQDKFEIYVSSGEVFLSKSLDYEDATEYTITIRAEVRETKFILVSINEIIFNILKGSWRPAVEFC